MVWVSEDVYRNVLKVSNVVSTMNTLMMGVATALASAFSWASSTILIRLGLRRKTPITVNIMRLYIISAVYIILLSVTGGWSEIDRAGGLVILVSAVSAIFGFVIGDYFYFSALKMLGVSRTVPITSTYPLWAILWSFLFLGKKVNALLITGSVLIVLAIVIVKRAEERESWNPRGFLYAFIAPISWSIAITLLGWLTGYLSPLNVAGLRMILAAMGVSVFLPRQSAELRTVNLKEIMAVGGAAISGLLIGQYLFVYSISIVGSQVAAPVSSVNPIIASYLAVVLLHEKPSKRIFEGLLMAVAGVILISLSG